MLSLLVAGVLILAFNMKPARAQETIFIRADGSIDPPTSPVSSVDNVTYTFTGNISSNGDGIVVERDNIVVDGAGYTLQGARVQYSEGIDLGGRSNVTIENTNINNFWCGIFVLYSNHNHIVGNNITNNEWDAIALSTGSSNNTISGNNITNNYHGVSVFNSSNNTVCYNNFINNTKQASCEFGSSVWDDGYPSGGNYWSDYNGTDLYHGLYQNETGSDGIGDTPYTIDEKNQDRYPFVEIIPEFSLLLVLLTGMLLTALLLILAKKKIPKESRM